MQVILGAGGVIGSGLARILPDYTPTVRLVSRNPQKLIPSNDVFAADLAKADEVEAALDGAEVAYLVAGIPYKAAAWESEWPAIMKNAIAACKAHGAKLVFFDNIYMYDRDRLSSMDEQTPIRPTTRKGAVRAEIADMLMSAVSSGEIQGLIARSADFYGPGKQANSVLTQTVFERIAAGKPAQWLLSDSHKHSFTYTPDAARGTALLGNTPDAYGGTWHLPTAPNPPTGREWIEAIAKEMGVEPRLQVAGKLLLKAIGLFSSTMREVHEMAYQYDRDYDFVSDKFVRRFGIRPTPYEEGIAAIVDADYRDSD